MDELRTRVARLVEPDASKTSYLYATALNRADRILNIPEIREALAARDRDYLESLDHRWD